VTQQILLLWDKSARVLWQF